AKFSGDIPKGEYGGGHVDIWDNGTWEPVSDFTKQLGKGHLEFLLHGRKLNGKWHLVRTRMVGKQPQWLLMKSHDEAARVGADADVIDADHADDAVRLPKKPSTRPAPKAAKAPQPRNRKSSGAQGDALPASIQPQLATLVDKVPGDNGWVY